MPAPDSDPFAAMEARIEQVFQDETAPAREKRDRGLMKVASLRDEFGAGPTTAPDAQHSGPMRPRPTRSEMLESFAKEESDDDAYSVSLRAAMIEAIGEMDGPITRKKVLDHVGRRYPHLRNPKDGTIASTFSRLKPDYLEPVENAVNVFRRKCEPVAAGILSDAETAT
jgi:hypothetical protein